MTKKPRRKAFYYPVTDHIYIDDVSFRVRMTRDGKKVSKNFTRAADAFRFRDSLLST